MLSHTQPVTVADTIGDVKFNKNHEPNVVGEAHGQDKKVVHEEPLNKEDTNAKIMRQWCEKKKIIMETLCGSMWYMVVSPQKNGWTIICLQHKTLDKNGIRVLN